MTGSKNGNGPKRGEYIKWFSFFMYLVWFLVIDAILLCCMWFLEKVGCASPKRSGAKDNEERKNG